MNYVTHNWLFYSIIFFFGMLAADATMEGNSKAEAESSINWTADCDREYCAQYDTWEQCEWNVMELGCYEDPHGGCGNICENPE